MERKILAAALNDALACSQLKDLLDVRTLSEEGQLIFKQACSYYATDPNAEKVDRELLIKSISRQVQSEKIKQLLTNVIKELPTDTSEANVLREVREHQQYVIGQKLAAALASNRTSELDSLLADYQRIRSTDEGGTPVGEEEYNSTSITALAKKSFDPSELIEIWPKQLNDQIDGGARRGHHVLIFAPTEMGKTLFAINMVAGFLRQGLRVLYVLNEDPAADVIMRLATRLLGKSKYDILDHPESADAALRNHNWGNFTLVAMAPGTFDRINSLATAGAYDCIVLDQLRNIDVKSGNRTEGLEKAATEARNLARKANALVVSVTQAADSASGKRVLNRGDVDSSNVGIPGQCDLMIGIGATADDEAMNERTLSFPKNKLSGNHNPIPVFIDPVTSKVIDE